MTTFFRYARLVLPLTLVPAGLLAADNAIKLQGKTASEVRIAASGGELTIRPLADGVIRVRFSDGKTPETPSLTLTEKITPPPFDVLETQKTILVATPKMQAEVSRKTGAVRFLDAKGQTLLAESGRALTPAVVNNISTFRVEQRFLTQPDEALYGMGQFQDGLWNWRGLPLELRQHNTVIASPVLVSTKGYGLFWDNASRTDFNPADTPVALSMPEDAATSSTGPTATEQLQNAPKKKTPPKKNERSGEFKAGAAGEYVFFAKDGDRKNEIAILLDGKQIAGVKNMWCPYSVTGTVKLSENQKVSVTLRGGGPNAKLFARPLGGDSTVFRSDRGNAIDYTVIYGPEMDGIIAAFRRLSGAAPLWPKWAYGFWQCRERYSSQQQLLDTAAEFRKRQIPMDLIVQDWQYWGKYGWGAYQWDEKFYPDPAALMNGLHGQNVKFMISVWCNPSGEARKELDQNKLMVGTWVDVFNPKGRETRWKYINKNFFSIGTDAWWGDATEPGDPGNDLEGKTTFLGAGEMVRNTYPLFASQSLYDGQRAANPEKRVCTLTRSSWPGMQRYAAAAWSGDINGNWETFRRQIPAGLNFCLTGVPYWTTDCGGFFRPGGGQYKNQDFNELLARWFQHSTFCPILRIHGYQTKTEPWEWLPETQKVILDYDKLRYRMLPYNYSVAWMVTNEGYTIMRPLAMDFRADAKTHAISDEYMFGPALLAAPVTTPKATSRKVYLPAGTDWFDFWTGKALKGGQEVEAAAPLETIPVFARAGAILPLGPDLQYANEKPADPIELRVYPGADGTFTLYEDEGDSYRYEKGAFATIALKWNDSAKTLTIGARKGKFPGMLEKRTFRVVFPGESQAKEVRYTGAETTVK